MSTASVSPHGFAVVRGRGYRSEQVDRYVAGLSLDRDEAWERAARLTVLAKEMEGEASAMRERVASLAPQTYATLGERAQRLMALVAEEADDVRTSAQEAAQAVQAAAEQVARRVQDAARADAEAVRTEGDVRAAQLLHDAQCTADDLRIGSRRDVKEWRGEALAVLKDMRIRTSALLAAQEKEQAERWEAVERELADRERESDARHAELTAYAEARLAEAKRALAEAEETARHGQEDAEARGAGLVAEGRIREERVARETDRIVREHEEAREELQAHMTHVRSSLAALTGRAPAEG
ncbi:cellulose-binding protein [Streptomyces sp. NBC_01465]|uniref:cellulose-binding protein n=1 Tax=Streptomyces sp. NBC_01465 TaxID=2903878 RepID=UPI002E312EBA|nr:cellulose-binding protein [Streptomyces sp. NBC_01465]